MKRCKRCKNPVSPPGLDLGENTRLADRLLSSGDRNSTEALEDVGTAVFVVRDVDRYRRGLCMSCFHGELNEREIERIRERENVQRAVEAMIGEGAPA